MSKCIAGCVCRLYLIGMVLSVKNVENMKNNFMKKLLITLVLLSFANSAMAQVAPKTGYHNYKGTVFFGYCIDGVEYLSTANESYLFPRLLPSGKPATCNY